MYALRKCIFLNITYFKSTNLVVIIQSYTHIRNSSNTFEGYYVALLALASSTLSHEPGRRESAEQC